jgi:hypothetical protein
MTTYLFRSTRDASMYAFTVDEAGQNVPLEHGPWKPVEDNYFAIDGHVMAASLRGIERDGYYIARREIAVLDVPPTLFILPTIQFRER